MRSHRTIKNIKVILIHLFVAAGIFYFIVHPFTMVVYWFEYSDTMFSISLFQKVLKESIMESFTFNMWGMGGLLTLLGAFLGIISGLFWINLKIKDELIDTQQRLLIRDIEELIQAGESERVEFKSSIRYDYFRKTTNRELEMVIAKTIGGFMNAKGGRLLLGVDDDGNILGLEKDFKTLKHKNKDGYEREIFRIISTYLGHTACFSNSITFYEISERDISVIDVEVSKEPVYVNNATDTTFYVRTGNFTYPLSVKETVEYLKTQKT